MQFAFEQMDRLHADSAKTPNFGLLQRGADFLQIGRRHILTDASNRQVRRKFAFFGRIAQPESGCLDGVLKRGKRGRGVEADPEHARPARGRVRTEALHPHLEGPKLRGFRRQHLFDQIQAGRRNIAQKFERQMDVACWNPAYQIVIQRFSQVGSGRLNGILKGGRQLRCKKGAQKTHVRLQALHSAIHCIFKVNIANWFCEID